MTLNTTTNVRRSLFDIGSDFEALEAILQECEGDISDPKATAAVDEWFEEIQTNEQQKVGAYLWILRKWQAEADMAKAQAERMESFAKVRAGRIAVLKSRMFEYMQRRGVTELLSPMGEKVRIQPNGGKQAMRVREPFVDDIEAIISNATASPISIGADALNLYSPEFLESLRPYLVAVVKLDETKVRSDLESGVPVRFAELLPRGKSLRIPK